MKLSQVLVLATSFVALTSLAGPALDADGVPKVDLHGTIVQPPDPPMPKGNPWNIHPNKIRMIEVEGKSMNLREFVLTYCQGKDRNDTCARAHKILSIDSGSGAVEKLPKGL